MPNRHELESPIPPEKVHLTTHEEEFSVPFDGVWSCIPFENGWTPCTFIKMQRDELENFVKSSWDETEIKKNHEMYVEMEMSLIRQSKALIGFASKNFNIHPDAWESLEKDTNKIAALRDYHDYRMAVLKALKKHEIISNKVNINKYRHHSHFYRIWNWIVFPKELRSLLCGEVKKIPKSVRQILLDCKKGKHVDESVLTPFIMTA